MVETQRASGLSKLTLGEESVAPESSAAPFAARLRIARWCNPGWRLSRNRVRLLAGRLNCLLRRKSNPVVPQTTRDSNTKCANPEFHSGLFSTVPQKERHCSGMAPLIWTSLQHVASLPCSQHARL